MSVNVFYACKSELRERHLLGGSLSVTGIVLVQVFVNLHVSIKSQAELNRRDMQVNKIKPQP